jgi:TIR domain
MVAVIVAALPVPVDHEVWHTRFPKRSAPARKNLRSRTMTDRFEKDVFISHASEDKLEVAEPLVDLLSDLRVTTWYDTQALKIGDSLREKIDEGLAAARFGVVILSPHFFSKSWPKEELDGLYSRRTRDGAFAILPVWHNVTVEQVTEFSPTLAGKVGVPTSLGLPHVASQIRDVVFDRHSSVDPRDYAQVHNLETLRLTDLPLAHGWIEHQYFSKCHLTGPAVLAIQIDTVISGCIFPSPEVFFPVDPGRSYSGMIGVRNSAFLECVFDTTVGFAVVRDNWNEIIVSVGQSAEPNLGTSSEPLAPPAFRS